MLSEPRGQQWLSRIKSISMYAAKTEAGIMSRTRVQERACVVREAAHLHEIRHSEDAQITTRLFAGEDIQIPPFRRSWLIEEERRHARPVRFSKVALIKLYSITPNRSARSRHI